jgi:hypothetical protein
MNMKKKKDLRATQFTLVFHQQLEKLHKDDFILQVVDLSVVDVVVLIGGTRG